jgi:hypothetical protein
MLKQVGCIVTIALQKFKIISNIVLPFASVPPDSR